jgi:hypothetical protein
VLVIRQIFIRNVRGLESHDWNPHPGLNWPEDSGKLTILDATDLCLGARHSYPFTDLKRNSIPLILFVLNDYL